MVGLTTLKTIFCTILIALFMSRIGECQDITVSVLHASTDKPVRGVHVLLLPECQNPGRLKATEE